MRRVSVIVPVYNVAPYLKRCIESLLDQTMKEIELILVDDGSTDGSEAICDEYAERNPGICVIHTPNQGLASARNTGIDAAESEYIMFADSDDYVEPDFCRIPYECAVKNHADLVIFGYSRTGFKDHKQPFTHEEGWLADRQAQYLLHHGMACVAWNKLYRRSLFETIRYPEGRVYEDFGTTYKLLHKADSIFYLNTRLYHYCYRVSSLSNHRIGRSELDSFELSLEQIRSLAEWNYPEIAQEVKDDMYLYYLVCFGNHGAYAKECSDYCRSLKLFPAYFPLSFRIMLVCYRYLPPVFDLISIFSHKRVRYPESV
ncbi:MAG: glycosyltransferase family 2 protein [Solobacterium sp.]|nr:glycosyltransferase family 2 protein [Solobacterium sp.]